MNVRQLITRGPFGATIILIGLLGALAVAAAAESWATWMVGTVAISVVSIVAYCGVRRNRSSDDGPSNFSSSRTQHPDSHGNDTMPPLTGARPERLHRSVRHRVRTGIPRQRRPVISTDTPEFKTPYLRLFGGPEVYVDDKPLQFKQGKRAKALLAALVLTEGPATREELMELVLADQASQSRRNYFNTIADQTRTSLSEATGRSKYAFISYDRRADRYFLGDFVATDIGSFDDAEQAAALATDAEAKVRYLEALVELYIDDLVPNMTGNGLANLRHQYRAAARRACEKLTEHYKVSGDQTLATYYQIQVGTLVPKKPKPLR